MADEIVVPDLTLALGIEVSEMTLVDDFFEVDFQESGDFFVLTSPAKPKMKWRFDGRQLLDVRDGPAGVFVATDTKGYEHFFHFYGVLSRYDVRRLTIEDYVDNEAEVDAMPVKDYSEEELMAIRAECEAAQAERDAPFDAPRWEVTVQRLLAENAALMKRYGVALPAKSGKVARKG